MTANLHGHVILERIIEAGGTMPLGNLRDFAESHGRDATYFTCSASGMSFDDLLEFLTNRNKISIADGQVTVYVENMCKHGDDEHAH
ncbi:MAG: YecH family protein [Polyangiaceae bacterium]